MAFFDPETYMGVKQRIDIFWQIYPNGRIINEIVLINEKEIVIKSSIYTDRDDKNPVAVDFAQENVLGDGASKTSWVENCSTSATGRAISLLGNELNASKKRASLEEMAKVWRNRQWLAEAQQAFDKNNIVALRTIVSEAQQFGLDKGSIDSMIQMGIELSGKGNAPTRKGISVGAPAIGRNDEIIVQANSSDKK